MSLVLFVLLASLLLVHVCAQTSPPPPTLPQKQVDVTRPTPLRQVRPADGAALQAAIDAAVAGDEILLMPGVTYAKTNGFNFNARKDRRMGHSAHRRVLFARQAHRSPTKSCQIDVQVVVIVGRSEFALTNRRLIVRLASSCTIGSCYVLWHAAGTGGDFGWRFELFEVVIPGLVSQQKKLLLSSSRSLTSL
jgi:hypothetical protein